MIRIVALIALCLGLTACETAKGVGKDLGAAGNSIQTAVNNVQNG